MGVEIRNQALPAPAQQASIVFDAEAVTLLGRYGDELSAHRARRAWQETLNGYFLLEVERDYETRIVVDSEEGSFQLACSFVSACGRYAFWRLLNHQAPEAEQRLCQGGLRKGMKACVVPADGAKSANLPWVITGAPKASGSRQRRARKDTLFGSLRAQLERLFG